MPRHPGTYIYADPSDAEWPSYLTDDAPTKRQLEVLSAWRRNRTYRGAAAELGCAEQTIKNTMGQLRLRYKTDNAGLIKRLWKLLALVDADPNLTYRKLRYEVDTDYRERQRRISRERMREIRAVRADVRATIYEDLYAAQDGLCAICHQPETTFANKTTEKVRRLAIDHDHKTGTVRELLCRNCNMMLGTANDDPERLQEGIRYLERHARPTSHKKGQAA